MPTLRPFQQTGRDFLARNPRALLGDQMGLGKTPQALTAAALVGARRVLILGPLATAVGWQREARVWAPALPAVQVIRRKTPIPADGDCAVFVPWTDLAVRLKDILTADRFDLLIADEAHRAKNYLEDRSKTASAFVGGWKKGSAGDWKRIPGAVDAAGRVWMLTGTPMPNGRPCELAPLLLVAGLIGQGGMSRSAYEGRFCRQTNRFSPRGYDLKGANDLAGLHAWTRASGRVLRRTKADVAAELPGLVRTTGYLTVKEPKLDRILNPETALAVEAAIKAGDLPPFEAMSAYRAALSDAKAEAALGWLQDWAEDNAGAPVVVFCHHKDAGRMLAEGLRAAGWGEVEFASGDDSAAERQAKVDRFADPNGPRAIIASMAACGTGMNGMQRRASTAVFVEAAWEAATLDQAEGRIRRMGRADDSEQVVAVYLVAADALDEHISAIVQAKREAIDEALDTDAGDRPAQPAQAEVAPPVEAEPVWPDEPPAPQTGRWSWSRDRQGDWQVRCNLDSRCMVDPHPWAGQVVRVVSSAGKAREVTLGAQIAGGATASGPWAVWSWAPVAGQFDRAGYLRRRAEGRGVEGRDVCIGEQDWPRARWAHDAAVRLTAMDADRASVRNGCGWNQADGLIGRELAALEPTAWTHRILALALATLRKYHGQIGTAPAHA